MTSTPGPGGSSAVQQHAMTRAKPDARRAARRALFWIAAAIGVFVLFISWFWLGLVAEGARQDQGQGGQAYADAYLRDLGIVPVVVAHLFVVATMSALGAWSFARKLAGFVLALALCAVGSVAGLLLSIPSFLPTSSLP